MTEGSDSNQEGWIKNSFYLQTSMQCHQGIRNRKYWQGFYLIMKMAYSEIVASLGGLERLLFSWWSRSSITTPIKAKNSNKTDVAHHISTVNGLEKHQSISLLTFYGCHSDKTSRNVRLKETDHLWTSCYNGNVSNNSINQPTTQFEGISKGDWMH